MSDNALNTWLAVQELRPRLPEIIGPEQWPDVAATLDRLDVAWVAAADEGERRRIARRYRDALAAWPPAYERVRAALDGMSAYTDALRRLALRAEDGGEPEVAAALRAEAEQRRLIIERGVGATACSIKLRNIDFRFWKLSALAAAVLATVAAVAEPAGSTRTIAAAVLSAIAGLEALVEEISVDDAGVFLGLVEAGGESRQAALADIMAATNAARATRPGYLKVMDEEAVKQSLGNLYRLRSIAPVNGAVDVWRGFGEYWRG